LIIVEPGATLLKNIVANRPKLLKEARIETIRARTLVWIHGKHSVFELMSLKRGG